MADFIPCVEVRGLGDIHAQFENAHDYESPLADDIILLRAIESQQIVGVKIAFDYTRLIQQVEATGITMLPGLLAEVVYLCVAKGVFTEGGIERFVAKAAKRMDHKKPVSQAAKGTTNA
jgi:hypothetical protein